MPDTLILASTSPYRKALLERLRIPFRCIAPDFSELAASSIPPKELVRKNTLGKGRSVAHKYPGARVIASDQVAVFDQNILGKPGTAEAACRQLEMLSGKAVQFLTGLAIIHGSQEVYECVPYEVQFRNLSKVEIRRYIEMDQPLNCAGSFKAESLGISLFEHMRGDDPTALIGLPLIRLSHYLRPLAFDTN